MGMYIPGRNNPKHDKIGLIAIVVIAIIGSIAMVAAIIYNPN